MFFSPLGMVWSSSGCVASFQNVLGIVVKCLVRVWQSGTGSARFQDLLPYLEV